MEFFQHHFQQCMLTVKVEASQEVRRGRGWVFQHNVDDAPSECGLDHYECDVTISNNSPNERDLTIQLDKITEWVVRKINH